MNQLPFLDAKTDYLWGEHELRDIADGEVPVLRVDDPDTPLTVRTVRDALVALVRAGYDDGVIPVLRAGDGQGERLVGVVGLSELEHALSIVADDPDAPVRFGAVERAHAFGEASLASLDGGAAGGGDPLDFGVYMDQAPLTVHALAPLELVHQFFAKLGAKYVVVTDTAGAYEGVIDKTAWLGFIAELERRAHGH
jgi:chloride channel 3/4/5